MKRGDRACECSEPSLAPANLGDDALFAAGHLSTELNAGRLAVFFPGVVFGWLPLAHPGASGAGLVFHALVTSLLRISARVTVFPR